MKKVIAIIISILLCLLTGYISQTFQVESLITWYPTLDKPTLTPPNIVFPIAWGILYICMGTSIGLLVGGKSENKKCFITIFLVQLFLNFTWSIIFFYFQNPGLGLINIVLLDILIIFYTIEVHSTNKVSSWLFVPYFLWVTFATYLNLYIYLYN